MFEGEERWSRACSNGIGLSNYKNVFRDGARVGNWQEDQYGKMMQDKTSLPTIPNQFATTSSMAYVRKEAERVNGSSGVESVPYQMLFGHGKVSQSAVTVSRCSATNTKVLQGCIFATASHNNLFTGESNGM